MAVACAGPHVSRLYLKAMRVRHFQAYLADQNLVQRCSLEKLRNCRVGIDAVYWLRSIQALKDPFADALGGIPPGMFGLVDKELDALSRAGITPLFVFQSGAPGPQHSMFVNRVDTQREPQHSMFVNRMDTQRDLAWMYLAKGRMNDAQRSFAVSTSRINGDLVYFILHYLRNRGYECLQAPSFAGAQLAHFLEQGILQTVFGPPGWLVFGVQSVVIHMDINRARMDWVDLDAVLTKWRITRDQLLDVCMLAGTEHCLTYPYLNLNHFQPEAPQRFNFDAAVFIVKQAPLIHWMQTFPSEEMKRDHLDGYCICKALVQNAPILHLVDNVVRPLGHSNTVPSDFAAIMGEKLPSGIYYLLLRGIISHKLPQALAKGEWTDKSQPLVDTKEFRDLLVDLTDYRAQALGLIARHLHSGFQNRRILCMTYWDSVTIQKGVIGSKFPPDARIMQPKIAPGLKWNITTQAVEAEMRRQGVNKVGLKFCLQWHTHEFETDGPLIAGTSTDLRGHSTCSMDPKALAALVHLMLLERLELIAAEDGGMTVLGNVLKDTPAELQEPCLVALEMMKFGVLSGEPFDAAQPEKPFPQAIGYPPVSPQVKATILLCRVMSLVPMKLKSDMWNATVDFDLAAFHAQVRILKRTLRLMVEAALASILLMDLQRVSLLPPGFMCASPNKEDHLQSPAMLPMFMLPRACMGIVVRYFLEYKGNPNFFMQDLYLQFPCCVQPLADLKVAFLFWDDLRRCVDDIADQLDATELCEDMRMATDILRAQRRRLGL